MREPEKILRIATQIQRFALEADRELAQLDRLLKELEEQSGESLRQVREQLMRCRAINRVLQDQLRKTMGYGTMRRELQEMRLLYGPNPSFREDD